MLHRLIVATMAVLALQALGCAALQGQRRDRVRITGRVLSLQEDCEATPLPGVQISVHAQAELDGRRPRSDPGHGHPPRLLVGLTDEQGWFNVDSLGLPVLPRRHWMGFDLVAVAPGYHSAKLFLRVTSFPIHIELVMEHAGEGGAYRGYPLVIEERWAE